MTPVDRTGSDRIHECRIEYVYARNECGLTYHSEGVCIRELQIQVCVCCVLYLLKHFIMFKQPILCSSLCLETYRKYGRTFLVYHRIRLTPTHSEHICHSQTTMHLLAQNFSCYYYITYLITLFYLTSLFVFWIFLLLIISGTDGMDNFGGLWVFGEP